MFEPCVSMLNSHRRRCSAGDQTELLSKVHSVTSASAPYLERGVGAPLARLVVGFTEGVLPNEAGNQRVAGGDELLPLLKATVRYGPERVTINASGRGLRREAEEMHLTILERRERKKKKK